MTITLEQVLKAYDYAESHPHKYLRGTTNWCAAVAHSLNVLLEQDQASFKARMPVGQIRDDLERGVCLWFGPVPPHGTNLYAERAPLPAVERELAELRKWEAMVRENSPLLQRLEAAEQRNAELVELLKSGRKVASDALGLVAEWADVLRKRMGTHCSAVDAALKPTGSGASEWKRSQ